MRLRRRLTHCHAALYIDLIEVPHPRTRAAEPHAAGSSSSQRFPDTRRDHLAFVLGYSSQDVQSEPRSVRVVGGDQLDVAAHERSGEGHVARKAIPFPHDQGRAS